MYIESAVIPNVYYDSLVLMQLGNKLLKLPGVRQAVVMMGTEENRASVRSQEMLTEQVRSATPNDLFIVVGADSLAQSRAALTSAIAQLEQGLSERPRDMFVYKTLDAAVRNTSGANLALISLPGKYAAIEARRALEAGLHVFLFSDNVPVEQEIALKQLASVRRRIVMGPDCGTSILGGAALGFANAVRPGPVGIVGAAGTGIQEVSSLVHRLGSGISQAIGTGTHDVDAQVGGRTLLGGLQWLAQDAHTQVIAVVSKPPSERVRRDVQHLVTQCSKPVIISMLGSVAGDFHGEQVYVAETLEDAALLAVSLSRGEPLASLRARLDLADWARLAQAERARLKPDQKYLRGLFSGGTFANEAAMLSVKALGEVYSNITLPGVTRLEDVFRSTKHTCVDMGDDLFTVGRPHPMLAPDLRYERLLAEAADPSTAVVLLDIVLGYGVHPDPAAEFASYIQEAKALAASHGRHLPIVVNVCGVDEDPQGRLAQVEKLERSGALIAPTNASATRLALAILTGHFAQATVFETGKALVDAPAIAPELAFDLPQRASVINLGLEVFAEALKVQGIPVTHVDFRPPALGDEALAELLSSML